MVKAITVVNFFILMYFIFSVIIYSILLIGSFFTIINYFNREKRANISSVLSSKNLPPVTVIIPMYNESENIVNMVESVIKSTYKNLYITIVNDVSTDDSMAILKEKYQLMEVPIVINQHIKTSEVKAFYISKNYSHIMVIDKLKNAGSGADSINIGINACFTPYFITIDADSFISPTSVAEFVYDILSEPHAVAVGGGVYILNGCEFRDGIMLHSQIPKETVPAIQFLEYMRSHLFGRAGWNIYGGTMAYSGTATLFDRKTVVDAGGYDYQNFAYDVEIIMKLNAFMRKSHRPYKILFNPAVSIWTDVPHTLKDFAKQRDKWRRGMLRSTLRYWYMFLNPKYGIQGIIGYPLYVLLEIMAPIIEFTAYISVPLAYFLGILNTRATILYIILAWGFISYITIANMFINLITFNRYKKVRGILTSFYLTILETFGFRQYTVFINMVGTFHYIINRLRGKPL